ncbi:MAG: Coenzyme F420 hydrogenase/dehydrogenase, beta subunit C-terminal domain [Dehalococcoidales bacterium]|nr:Coenzyme F420 hydrogenase/dehydrogenase, beta subunit C-terminal domain [Dehalococcoidales bacterium]
MAVEAKGSRELFKEVIEAGLCTYCGACSGGCPYLVPYKGKIALLDNCTRDEGQCYGYCPRTFLDMSAISQQVFGVPYGEDELGTVKEVMIARSTGKRIKEKGQYGGTVTALMSLALAEGLIDGAILTRTGKDKAASAYLANSAAEVLQGAGSNYLACPVLETYNRTPKDSHRKLGIVGVPCQVIALSKMKQKPPENRPDIGDVKLVVGLFCTWALSPDGFYKFLKENVDLPKVTRFDIPPPPAKRFDAYIGTERKSFPLEQIRQHTMPTCAYCLDMTAEFADISVGSVEGLEGWNTVIVRTRTGAELMETAKKKKKLEIDKLPAQNLAHLKEASLLKKKRALTEIIKRSGSKNKLLYLGLSPRLVDKFLNGQGGK